MTSDAPALCRDGRDGRDDRDGSRGHDGRESSPGIAAPRPGLGYAFAALAAFIAGAYLVCLEAAARTVPRKTVVVVMLAIAALLNTGVTVVKLRQRGGPAANAQRKDTIILVVALAFFAMTGNLSAAQALAHLHPGTVSALLQSQTLLAALFAWLLLREPITKRFVLGAILGLIGVGVMKAMGEGDDVSLEGILWTVGAGASFAGIHVTTRQRIERVDPLVVNSLRLYLAFGFTALLVGGLDGVAQIEGSAWLWIVATASSGPVVARLLLMEAARHLEAARSTMLLMLSPLFATLLGGLLFGRWPGAPELAGGALMLVGVGITLADRLGPRRAVE